MANISNYTEIIKNESLGEPVRDAIIEVLKLFNKMGGSVSSLDGHEESYFASSSEMSDIVDTIYKEIVFSQSDEDAKPKEDSEIILTSGQIWDAVNAVDGVLEDLNNYERPIGDLIKNLEAIESAKEKILSAIKVKSPGKFTKKSNLNTKDFRKYAEYIHNLPGPGNVNMKELSITEKQNDPTKPIVADEQFDDADNEHRYAYNKIVTNVSHKVKQYSTSYNEKNLTAPEGYVGFNKITVSESSHVGTGRSGSSRSGALGGNRIDENGIKDRFEVTANRVYTASEDGCEGWRTVYVHVDDPEINFDATYTVNFYDSDEEGNQTDLLYTANDVPFNGYAVCPEDKKPQDDPGNNRYFAGWTPPPSRIRRATDCVAMYNDQPPSVEEIPDSWETIVENRGAPYAPGAYKTLVLNNGVGTIRMQKVYSGEDVSTSSWVAMDCLTNLHRFSDEFMGTWSTSTIRTWLNGEFYNNHLPELIRDCIVDVKKYTYELDKKNFGKFISCVRDKVWIPSLQEVLGDIDNTDYKNFANDYYYQYYVDGQTVNYYGGTLDNIISEYPGIHYKDVYPTSTIYTGPNDDMIERAPTSASPLIKLRNGTQSEWVTRTYRISGRSYNDNNDVSNHVGFLADGTRTQSVLTGGYWADRAIVIGFCL